MMTSPGQSTSILTTIKADVLVNWDYFRTKEMKRGTVLYSTLKKCLLSTSYAVFDGCLCFVALFVDLIVVYWCFRVFFLLPECHSLLL